MAEGLRGLLRVGVVGGRSAVNEEGGALLLRLSLVRCESSSPASDVLRLGWKPSVSLSRSSGGRTGLKTGLDGALDSGLVSALDDILG